jgi:hypothetical protein
MRLIRPASHLPGSRRRPLLLAGSMVAAGVLAIEVALLGATTETAAAILAATAAICLGVGAAWLVRALRPDRGRRIADAIAMLLDPAFDDSYTLVLAPRLPIRDAVRLDGVLIGPGGVRVLTARDWEGRYRVRQRIWEFDARGRRGWIRCRTNPSFDAIALVEGLVRWMRANGLPDVPVKPAIAFPLRHSRIVLEEPMDEVVTADNAPWWANTIGRVRRLDPATGARLLEGILDAAERPDSVARTAAPDPR